RGAQHRLGRRRLRARRPRHLAFVQEPRRSRHPGGRRQAALQSVRRDSGESRKASLCKEGPRPSLHQLARFARRAKGDCGLQDQGAGVVLPQRQCTGGMMVARLAVILAATTIAVPALASEPVLLHAAGSLRTALTEVTEAFEAALGQKVQAKYGPSGTLKDEIAGGAHAEVFASANMEHPQALATAGKSGPACFSRATGCAPWCGLELPSSREQFSTACSTRA